MIKRVLKKILKKLGYTVSRGTPSHGSTRDSMPQDVQRLLALTYKQMFYQKMPLPSFSDVGFRFFSQNDEDGILLFIFSLIGTTNKTCIDIAFASPHGANTTNLLCNWGWQGVLFCGKADDVVASKKFFSAHPDTNIFPPCIKQAWVTAENVNELLKEQQIAGDVDLLSLDIDGVDYWLWKNLSIISPRVVVVEYHNIWPADRAVTVPYRPDFNRFDTHEDYCGASLAAFVKLGKQKGYRLVGCNKYGFNAFFVRDDVGVGILPEIDASSCLNHPQALYGQKYRLPHVQTFEWIDV